MAPAVPLRHVRLRELLAIIATELQWPEEELQDDELRRRAKNALDRVAARRPNGQGGRGTEIFRTMPAKYVALMRALLCEPPVPEAAGVLAFVAGGELLRRGGARWIRPEAASILRLERWAVCPDEIDERWLTDGVGPAGRRRTGSTQADSLFDSPPTDTVGVYLGHALRQLEAAGLGALPTTIHEECEQALARASRRTAGAISFKLIHPSHDVVERNPSEVWSWDVGLLEESAVVLAVADIERVALSFGVACELAVFHALPGASLHLRSDGCRMASNYLDGIGAELGVETVRCSDWREVPAKLEAWLLEHLDRVLDGVRRRDDAVALIEPLHRQIQRAWGRLSRLEREIVCDAAALTRQRMHRVCERPAAFAALPAHAQARLKDLLLVPDRPPMEGVNAAALIGLAADKSWSATRIARVLDEAQRRVASVDALATRPAYSDRDGFLALYNELYGQEPYG